MNELPKHHYIPVFYLREWANDRGRLVEFSRPTGAHVAARPCGPKGTGYVRGLYRLHATDEERAEAFERYFFQFVDNQAKDALDMLLRRKPERWNDKTRSAWTRFLMGMIFRNPERIEAVRVYAEQVALDHMDEAVVEYLTNNKDDSGFLDALQAAVVFNAVQWTQTTMNSQNIGNHILNMRWKTRDITQTGLTFFTSDRPLIMTNGMTHEHSHLAIPISPTMLFLAFNTSSVEDRIMSMSQMELLSATNSTVLKYAKRYAWNTDDRQINKAKRWLSVESDQIEDYFLHAPRAALAELKAKQLIGRNGVA